MTRCLTCDGIMAPGETACYACGEKAPAGQRQRSPAVGSSSKSSPSAGSSTGCSGWAPFLQIAFFGSLILTVASLVVSDYTPPFKACLTATVVVLLLKMVSGPPASAKQ